MLDRAALDDGCLDALALVQAAAAGDIEALGAVLAAWDGQDGLPLIVALLSLIDRLLAETGTDPGEWVARVREHMTVP
jgi:hypothetical protein